MCVCVYVHNRGNVCGLYVHESVCTCVCMTGGMCMSVCVCVCGGGA